MEGDVVWWFMKEPKGGGAVLNFWQLSDLLEKKKQLNSPSLTGYSHWPEEYESSSIMSYVNKI